MANVIGTDISFWQDDPQTPEGIDFAKMRQNAEYVIIRAGQNLWTDRDFKVNWREAKRVGLPRGSYWFYDSRADPKQQAELWASIFSGDFGELPLFADFEDNYGGAFSGWRHWYTFLERIKQLAPGREIGIYTAYYYWVQNTISVGIPAASLDYFKQYPLWIANYGVSTPLVPKPWTDWTFWQFTDKGNGPLYGVESLNIDLNYFNGDLPAFRARFNLSDTPIPIPDPEPPSKFFRVTTGSLRVREGAGTNFAQIGSIVLNEVVEEINANADRSWLQIRKLDNSLTGWAFSAYLHRTAPPTDPDPTPEPPPPPPPKWHRVTTASLRVREGPGTNFAQVGSVILNEVVEEIGANLNRTWIQIRKADGSLTGWCSADFLQETTPPTPLPGPDPTPEPPPPQWYRVTTASLRVREGPGTNYSQIGSLVANEVVEEVGANADRSWLQIRKADGSLTGWSSLEFLQPTDPPDPEPPPDEEDENWYRVTASSLKVREGPGLDYDAIGLLYFGELVERTGASPDGEWFSVRNQTRTLAGWSSSAYLESVHAPAPQPPPSTPPAHDHNDKNWYRVNTATLNVREGPGTSNKVVGTLSKNDTLPALDDTSNNAWVQIERVDGMKGWCSKVYLVSLGKGRPSAVTQNLFPGVTYLRKDLTAPRLNVVHVIAIDMQTAKLEFLVTPANGAGTSNVLCTRTTSKFLEEFRLHVAVNGGYFSYLDATFPPEQHCPNGGDPVRISDYAASRGRIYSPKQTAQPTIYIGQKNQVSINKLPGNVFNAISGDRMVVENGAVVKNLAANAPSPRTAIGFNRNFRWMTLMVVDGRQPGYSEGVTFPELAELLISYGVHTGVNMDGGGSSAMSIKGIDNQARILNSPVDLNQSGKERAVGNHLGLFIRA
ncbi:MAG TPA: SH3 domain-containing protein [Anaerolineales bacterium]|nr:SH3 domain-containing protein [Anaerolineales bacterium]